MANITIRIDEDIKNDIEKLFEELGFSISGAINVFLRQALREKAIPFQIRANVTDSNRLLTNEEKYNEYFNPHNMKILMESIEQAKTGKVITKTLSELEAMEND